MIWCLGASDRQASTSHLVRDARLATAFGNQHGAWPAVGHAPSTTLTVDSPEIPALSSIIGGCDPAFPCRARWNSTVQPSLVPGTGHPPYREAHSSGPGYRHQETHHPAPHGVRVHSRTGSYDEASQNQPKGLRQSGRGGGTEEYRRCRLSWWSSNHTTRRSKSTCTPQSPDYRCSYARIRADESSKSNGSSKFSLDERDVPQAVK